MASKAGPRRSKARLKPSLKAKKRNLARSESSPPDDLPESGLQMHCWQWFKKAYPYVLMFHVPNGELRHISVADKLKRMGVVPGVADFLAFPLLGTKHAIELKTLTGSQKTAQERFERYWTKSGGSYDIARTLEDFQAVCLRLFGAPLDNSDPGSAFVDPDMARGAAVLEINIA